MSEITVISKSAQQTRDIGQIFADLLIPPFNVLLQGELGAGKTEFVRGFLSRWGFNVVRSPSFTVVNTFNLGSFTVHHIDLFRITDVEEILIRGIFDLLDEEDSIRFIEWPELLLDKINPLYSLLLRIDVIGPNERKISFYTENIDLAGKIVSKFHFDEVK